MHGMVYKYTSCHHQDNWNAEHCRGGRIKRKSLTKTSDMMQCAGLLRLKAAHNTSPQVTVGIKSVYVGRPLELRKFVWEYRICVLLSNNKDDRSSRINKRISLFNANWEWQILQDMVTETSSLLPSARGNHSPGKLPGTKHIHVETRQAMYA